MSLTNLITQDINSKYCIIKYADFDIIMCKKDQYLNMTKIVKLDKTRDGNPKELSKWINTNPAQIIIAIIEEEIRRSDDSDSRSHYLVNTGEKSLHGTYCHKLLVPHILSWCSAKFAVKVSKIVNMYYEYMGDIKTAEANRKHEELITEIRSQSEKQIQESRSQFEKQLADNQIKHNKQIEEIKSQATATRKEIIDKHNDLVRRFNGQKSVLIETNTKLTTTNHHLSTIQSSCKILTDQLITMNIKNDKLRAIVVDTHAKVSSIPIETIKPETRTFDVIAKPPKKGLQTFLILTTVRIISPVVRDRYIVNRVQWRSYKRSVMVSITKVLSEYTDPVYTVYHPFFESSASAITVWNLIRSRYQMNGSMLNASDNEFANIMEELRTINVRPEDELKILSEEYERLKKSTDEQDKEFLADLESAEDL